MPTIKLGSVAPSIGAALGSGISSSLNRGLDMLAQQKMQQMQQNRYAAGLTPLIGQEAASFLSTLNPEERKYALQNIGSLMQLTQQPQQVGGQQQFMEQPGAQYDVQGGPLQSLMGMQQGASPLQALMQGGMPQAVQRPGQPQQQALQAQPNERAKLIEDIFKSPQQKMQEKSFGLKEAALEERKIKRLSEQEAREKKLALQYNKDYIDNTLKKHKSIKEDNLRLNRMMKKIESGNLPNAALWKFLTDIEEVGPISTGAAGAAIGGALGSVVPGAGTALGAALGGITGSLVSPFAGIAKSVIRATSPDVEEFEKLSADFIKNAKQYFGSRLTDADLNAYLKTIPTLMQTDAGKKQIIENIKIMNDIAGLEAQATKDIIQENDGKPPFDLQLQVENRISQQLDQLAERFVTR